MLHSFLLTHSHLTVSVVQKISQRFYRLREVEQVSVWALVGGCLPTASPWQHMKEPL